MMTNQQIDTAVEIINHVERELIAGMSEYEYQTWMSFSEEYRKQFLYLAYKSTR